MGRAAPAFWKSIRKSLEEFLQGAPSCVRDLQLAVIIARIVALGIQSRVVQLAIAILISHRFSTVRMASQIVVIENGRIIERGAHEELMARTKAQR